MFGVYGFTPFIDHIARPRRAQVEGTERRAGGNLSQHSSALREGFVRPERGVLAGGWFALVKGIARVGIR